MKSRVKWRLLALAAALALAWTGCGSAAPLPSPAPPLARGAHPLPPPPPPPGGIPSSSETPDRGPGAEALAPRVEEICRERRVVGMSLAVFDSGGVFYQQSWGWAVREREIPAAEDTIYRAASLSKAVTALLALDLAGRGRLDLDAGITQLGGCPVGNPAWPDRPITARHLLTHTSGIQDSWAYWDAVGRSRIPSLCQVLPYSYGDRAPGEAYSYSNLGMGLMSGVVETASGEPFLDYTRERVFSPMAVDAAYSYTDIVHKERVADLYEGGERTVDMTQWRNMSAKYEGLPLGQLYSLGHGDLFITAGDLCRFAQIMAGCPRDGEPVALTPELLEGMQTAQYQDPDPAGYGCDQLQRGLGTHITHRLLEDRRMAGHQGNAYGSICGMFFDPAEQTGFVLLTNGASAAADSSGLYLVNRDMARAVYGAFFGYKEEGPEEP